MIIVIMKKIFKIVNFKRCLFWFIVLFYFFIIDFFNRYLIIRSFNLFEYFTHSASIYNLVWILIFSFIISISNRIIRKIFIVFF